MRIAIIGPMTGIPDWNYPAFADAASYLRGMGHEVFNPAETFGGETHHPKETYMWHSIMGLLGCEGAILLPGWEMSEGATTEHRVARAVGLEVWTLEEWRRLL